MVKPSLHWQTLRPLANGISQALRLALPVLFLPFVARVLGPEETGRYLVYMQVSVWLAVVADAGFSLYFIEFAATAEDERETHRFFWTDYFARLAMYALVGLGALGVAYLAGSDLPILAVSIVTGWVLGSGLSVLRHFRGSVTAIAFGDLVTTVIYGVAITAFLPSAPTAVAAFSTFVGSLLMGMLVHMLTDQPVTPRHLQAALPQALRRIARHWWFLAMRTAAVFQSQSIILLAALLYGSSAAGHIGVAERLFAASSSLVAVGAAALSPMMVRQMRTSGALISQIWYKATFVVILTLTGMYLLAFFKSEEIIHFLYGLSYRGSYIYFLPLAILYLASAFNMVFLFGLAAPMGESRSMFLATISAPILMLLVTFLLPRGVEGILMGRLAAELALAFYAVHLLWRWRRRATS